MNMKVPHYETENHTIRIRPNMVRNDETMKEELAYITITAGSRFIHINVEQVAELGELIHELYQDLIQ